MRAWLIVAGLALPAVGCGRTERTSEHRHLAFVADSVELGRFDLHVLDDRALEIRVLATAVGHATWSPDGRWLAFSGEGVLVADSEHDWSLQQLSAEGSQIHWSATSRWLAFNVQSPSPALVLRDVLGLEPDRVEPVEESSHAAGTGWSPQGDAYLFQRSGELNVPEEWFVVTPGEPARPLGILGTGLTARNLGWSPDGQRIAMYLTGDDDRELLYAVDVREQPMLPRLLLDPGAGSSVAGYAWSGDSSLLIARCTPGPTLWRVPAAGSSPEAFAQQVQHWQLADLGRTLAYVSDQQLFARTLSGGQFSEPTLIEARAVDSLHASAHSDSLLFQLSAEPGRSYRASASGGPVTPLHEPERQHAEHDDAPISPDGERVLLDLDAGEEGRELRAVELGPSATQRVSIPVSENNPFALVAWGDRSRFSFAYAVDGWQSLYLCNVEEGSIQRVYTPASNLRTIQWTGWQP